MADARSWTEEHGEGLVGLSAELAAGAVTEVGLRPRVVAPGEVVTLEYRPDRVTLAVDEHDVVTAVRPG